MQHTSFVSSKYAAIVLQSSDFETECFNPNIIVSLWSYDSYLVNLKDLRVDLFISMLIITFSSPIINLLLLLKDPNTDETIDEVYILKLTSLLVSSVLKH